MYRRNRVPMYEGDGFIHSSPRQDGLQNPGSQPATPDPVSPTELRPSLNAAARGLLHRLAVRFGSGARHCQAKALER